MQIGDVVAGFRLLNIKPIEEIEGRALVFKHERTRLLLVKLETPDDNKFFSISFRTPPPNARGLPHILEHSVLCGSDRFPTKDPFADAAKGSLKTFINAMTYDDHTVYPVGSRCVTDFFNLMNIYMDAVFHPLFTRDERIFQQEGSLGLPPPHTTGGCSLLMYSLVRLSTFLFPDGATSCLALRRPSSRRASSTAR